MKSNEAEIAVSMKLGKYCPNNLVQSLIQKNMSSHARRCFSFAKMLKCVVGFPILRDLVLRQVIPWSQLFKNRMTL